ncbi:MAG: tetratricopeptide repeat protein [Elusimicrobiota bacterium]
MRRVDFLILALLSSFVFADTFRVPFMWDDIAHIQKNASIRELDSGSLLKASHWREQRTTISPQTIPLNPVSPVRSLSYMIDYRLWGLKPMGYHLTNLLSHIAVVFLFYVLCWTLFTDRKTALIAALLFAVHPMHVETVAWLKNRLDLFATAFFFSSVILFVRAARGAAYRRSHLAGSFLCYLLALLSKETAVTLPAVLGLYVFAFAAETWRRPDWRLLRWTVPFWAITAAYLRFQFAYVNAGEIAGFAAAQITLLDHGKLVLESVGCYLTLMAWPFTFSLERRLPAEAGGSIGWAVGALAAVSGCLWAARRLYAGKERGLFFGLLFALGTLVPVANIVFLVTRPISESRLYLPSAGWCILLALAAAWGLRRPSSAGRRLSAGLCAVLVGAFSLTSMRRTCDWRSPVRLWESTVAASPESYRAHYNLGAAYLAAARLDDGMASFERASRIVPEEPLLQNALGVLYEKRGRDAEAAAAFRKSLALYPQYDDAHTNLGYVYYKGGKKEAALQHLRAAVGINPHFDLPHVYLALIYKDEGRTAAALAELRRACEINLYAWEDHRRLIALLEDGGRFEEAAAEYRRALAKSPELIDARNDLGIVYVRREMYAEAEAEFRRVLKHDPANQAGLKNLDSLQRLLRDVKKS